MNFQELNVNETIIKALEKQKNHNSNFSTGKGISAHLGQQGSNRTV